MYFLENLLPQSEHGCLPDAGKTEPELPGNEVCKDKHTQFDKQTATGDMSSIEPNLLTKQYPQTTTGSSLTLFTKYTILYLSIVSLSLPLTHTLSFHSSYILLLLSPVLFLPLSLVLYQYY